MGRTTEEATESTDVGFSNPVTTAGASGSPFVTLISTAAGHLPFRASALFLWSMVSFLRLRTFTVILSARSTELLCASTRRIATRNQRTNKRVMICVLDV